MEFSTEMLLAMADDKFQQILRNDQVLNKLDEEKNDKRLEYLQIMSLISKVYNIGEVKIVPITPILWSFLYCIGNRYVTHQGQIREEDTDVFLYLLHNGLNSISEDLFEEAEGFCPKNGLDYLFAQSELYQMILLAFRPQQMFPVYSKNESGEENRFNLDWLTKICSMAAQMTNKTTDELAFNTSLTEVLSYVVQYVRKGRPDDDIRRRNSDQINEGIYRRTMELGQKYYEQNYKNK